VGAQKQYQVYQKACKLINLQAFAFLAISIHVKQFQGLLYLFGNLFSIFSFEVLKQVLISCYTDI